MTILVGDTIYFDAYDSQDNGNELWAHNTTNSTTWQLTDISSGTSSLNWPGFYMDILVGDTLYFSSADGNTGVELWAHDTSNHSTWQVADIFNGSDSSNPGGYMHHVVGDTIYFNADNSAGQELWAYDTSNQSIWRVTDINSEIGRAHV